MLHEKVILQTSLRFRGRITEGFVVDDNEVANCATDVSVSTSGRECEFPSMMPFSRNHGRHGWYPGLLQMSATPQLIKAQVTWQHFFLRHWASEPKAHNTGRTGMSRKRAVPSWDPVQSVLLAHMLNDPYA